MNEDFIDDLLADDEDENKTQVIPDNQTQNQESTAPENKPTNQIGWIPVYTGMTV